MNDLSGAQYFTNKNITFKTFNLRSDLCDYKDSYIIVKDTIDLLVVAENEDDKAEKDVAFKNNAPLRSCISKLIIH